MSLLYHHLDIILLSIHLTDAIYPFIPPFSLHRFQAAMTSSDPAQYVVVVTIIGGRSVKNVLEKKKTQFFLFLLRYRKRFLRVHQKRLFYFEINLKIKRVFFDKGPNFTFLFNFPSYLPLNVLTNLAFKLPNRL